MFFPSGPPAIVRKMEFGALYKGIFDNLAEMKFVSKLDTSAQVPGKGLEGLGMTCTSGSRMVRRALLNTSVTKNFSTCTLLRDVIHGRMCMFWRQC